MHIPEKISLVLKKLYPALDQDEVYWKWEVPGRIYAALFIDNKDEDVCVEITITGNHLCTRKFIDEKKIPAAVRRSVTDNFNTSEPEDFFEVKFSDGQVLYEVSFAIEGDENEEQETDEQENEVYRPEPNPLAPSFDDDYNEDEDTLWDEMEAEEKENILLSYLHPKDSYSTTNR